MTVQGSGLFWIPELLNLWNRWRRMNLELCLWGRSLKATCGVVARRAKPQAPNPGPILLLNIPKFVKSASRIRSYEKTAWHHQQALEYGRPNGFDRHIPGFSILGYWGVFECVFSWGNQFLSGDLWTQRQWNVDAADCYLSFHDLWFPCSIHDQ